MKNRINPRHLLALAGLLVLATMPSHAAPPPPVIPTIETTKAGVLTPGGTYQWEWEVCFGARPALSHFQLMDLCPEVWADVVPGTVFGGTGHEFGFNPPTGTTGLKWEVGGDDGDCELFGFETSQAWAAEPGTVVFKSGQLTYTQDDVLIPHCEPEFPPVPEPTSVGLLATGALGILARRRRGPRPDHEEGNRG